MNGQYTVEQGYQPICRCSRDAMDKEQPTAFEIMSLIIPYFLGSNGRAARRLATSARPSPIDPISPVDIACVITFPSAVASTGPASTVIPVASAAS
jgi:hypothetical protein